MDELTIYAFLAMGAVIFIGFFGQMFFNKYRVPDVLLLIFLGMLIGPDLLSSSFGLITTERLDRVNDFRDFFLSAALVIILFDGGLSLDMKVVIDSMRLSAFMSVLTFILEMIVIAALLSIAIGLNFMLGLTLGAIVGGTTGAVVIPIVNKMRIRQQTKTMLIMESVITDVLVIVLTLTLLSVIVASEFSFLTMVWDLVVKFLFGGAVGFLAGILWLFVLDRLHNQPLSYMITVAALFILAGAVEVPPIESSGAVAALAFGLAMGNRKFVKKHLTALSLTTLSDDHIHHFHTEITFFVRTFFFVYLGLSFRFGTFSWEHLLVGLLLVSVTLNIRRLTSKTLSKIGELEEEDAYAVFALMPRGLSAAVLATLPAAMLANESGLWTEDLGPLFVNATLVVILVTNIIATILSFHVEKGIDKRNRKELRNRLMNS